MATNIKKIVDAICSLTVLQLCELVKALRDKFGLRTLDRGAKGSSEEESKPVPDPSPIEPDIEPEDDKPPKDICEGEEKPEKPKEELKSVPDPVEPDDKPDDKQDNESEDTEAKPDKSTPEEKAEEEENGLHIPSSDELEEDEDFKEDEDFEEDDEDFKEDEDFDENDENDLHILYAWRWSGNNKHAKIGITTESRLDDRIRKGKTYHPTDDVIPIGVCIEKYPTRPQVREVEKRILEESELERVRPDREWVQIDEKFEKMIDKYFEKE